MTICAAGIDVGSITTKAAVISTEGLLGTAIVFTGYNTADAAQRVFDRVLLDCSLVPSDIAAVVSTGYGRNSVSFTGKAITEIICHGTGAHYLNPAIRSVVDVGGQDSKALILNGEGRTTDFAMNDKCAAGTGRFLEVMARALEVDLDDFGLLSLQSAEPSRISSICTVFAESEVISLISGGEKREDIIAGIHESAAARVAALAHRVGVRPPLMMTGGVARNAGIVAALERKLDMAVEVSPRAQLAGAIGAAVLALKNVME
ncbi:MAG: acyl-CoA dehydratase activase [Syntrophales bacterium]|nr:acyl-CoA dehydratase activase [Syntrophales bacterium]MCK9527393.1 acyl-CoA dehydratase activase [Syntrophales bacterium]MDX9921495.1 acyl-CoA dehydratase activase [Syntrophales bacterium]